MKRLASLIALALVVALPLAASAKKHPASPLPGAMSSATMPSCPAGDPVVWVNTATHVYHLQGTKFFGTTKHGTYACTAQAVAMGARPAKHGAAKTVQPAESPAPLHGKHRHHKKDAGDADAVPAVTPSPK